MTATEPPAGALTPRYYLIHDTPAGQRFAYPIPEVPKQVAWNTDSRTRTWTSPDAALEFIPPPRPNYQRQDVAFGWVIADAPLRTLVMDWTETAGLSGRWAKVEKLDSTDPVLVAAWETAPAEPTADTITHYESHDGESCVTCQIVRTVYRRVPNPRIPKQHVVDLSEWAPLPGDPDPDVNRDWTVDDPSTLAVYGRHTAHLWPGTMGGFRDAVVAALKAHPRTSDVYDHDRDGTVSAYWSIPWDIPRPPTPRQRRETVAVRQHSKRVVPDRLAAPSKAEALAIWDQTVAEWVDMFVPAADTDLAACSHCDGAGFIHHTIATPST